MNNKLKLWSYL